MKNNRIIKERQIMNMDLAQLTTEVRRIAMDAGRFLKEERKKIGRAHV